MVNAKWRTVLGLALTSFLGILAVSSHLNDSVWQDEAYTLINFSMRGWLFPFTDYHLPNNHILLSSFMSYWWSPNDSLLHLRLPLFLSFIIGIAIFAYAAFQRFGYITALVAVLFFSLSSITPHFALQLRGYGISWLFVSLLLWATPNFIQHGRLLAGFIYLLSSVALVALIPTNIIVCGVFVAWSCALLLDHEADKHTRIRRFLFVALTPLLGGLAYIAVGSQLLLISQHAFSNWGRVEAYGELIKMLAVEFWIFLPLMTVGTWMLWQQSKHEGKYAERGLVLAALFFPFLMLFIFKNALFPRNLVPLIPIYCLVGGILVKHGSRFLKSDTNTTALIIVLSAVLMIMRSTIFDCSAVENTERTGNLCRHYYHSSYRPEPIVGYLAAHRNEAPLVVSGYEGLYAMAFLNINYGLGLNLMHYRQFPQGSSNPSPWIVLGLNDRLTDMLAVLPKTDYVEVLDSGYFKLYKPIDK